MASKAASHVLQTREKVVTGGGERVPQSLSEVSWICDILESQDSFR